MIENTKTLLCSVGEQIDFQRTKINEKCGIHVDRKYTYDYFVAPVTNLAPDINWAGKCSDKKKKRYTVRSYFSIQSEQQSHAKYSIE